jgi:hypothetical protein
MAVTGVTDALTSFIASLSAATAYPGGAETKEAPMDMNQLFSRHQRAQMHARQAGSRQHRAIYVELAEHYARRIADYRAVRDLPRYNWA